MEQYPIHKGVDKTVEFKGLTAQYLAYFVGGVLALVVFFAAMRALDIPVFLNLAIVGVLLAGLVGGVFRANKKYGKYGLVRKRARNACPRFLLSRRCFNAILRQV
jgi:hypothetical protein